MAVKGRAVSVTTAATRLDSTSDTDLLVGESVACFNNAAVGGQTVYVGGSDVTTVIGAPVPPQSWSPSFQLNSGEALYGIVGSSTADVRVVETGV